MKQVKQAETMNGARAVVQSLLEEGVDTIFGYPGGAIMPIYDELMEVEEKVRHILPGHEQGAAHAAQAYAQVSGKTAVCFATSGPGATNLVTGIANAYLDSIPVVFITAQVISSLIGSAAFSGDRYPRDIHPGDKVELSGQKSRRNSRHYCQSIFYRRHRKARAGIDRHHQRCFAGFCRLSL